jgi:putative oxidoreductase
MNYLLKFYRRASAAASRLRSPFLLAVRLYWGWQFVQTGWGKMHNIGKIVAFFASLNIPFPSASAHFVAGLEFFGGILLILGLATRLTGLLLAGNMLVATGLLTTKRLCRSSQTRASFTRPIRTHFCSLL